MTGPHSVQSVKLQPGAFEDALAAALGRHIPSEDLPTNFQTQVGALDGINFLFDRHGRYIEEANSWLIERARTTKSANTRNTISASLKASIRWYEDNYLDWRVCTELAHINIMHLHFRATPDPLDRSLKPLINKSTWNLRAGYWYRFLAHGAKKGFVEELNFDLSNVLERGKSERIIRALQPEEYRRLLNSSTSQRLRAGMNVMAGTGMRSSENAALKVSDIPPLSEFGGSSYRPRNVIGKGDKTREILWPFTAAKTVWAYYRVERSIAINELRLRIRAGERPANGPVLHLVDKDGRRVLEERPDAPLWLTEKGEPLSSKRWGKDMAAAQAGSGTSITPHWLRHTFAIVMLSNLIKEQLRVEIAEAKLGSKSRHEYFRSPLDEVRRRLGHASTATTMIYLDYIAEHRQLLQEAIRDLEQEYMDA